MLVGQPRTKSASATDRLRNLRKVPPSLIRHLYHYVFDHVIISVMIALHLAVCEVFLVPREAVLG